MSRPHRYTVNPEFTNLEKFVWEGLNSTGRTVHQIRPGEDQAAGATPDHKRSMNRPVWHSKSELDEFVSRGLGLKLDDYGTDKSRNALYKAIANEIARLRRAGVLVDLRKVKPSKTGMGIWRLDRTRLERLVYSRAKREIKDRDYSSTGTSCVIFVRQKQNAFRNELLAEYCKRCALCGFKIPEYMIGAHIVPYSVMREEDPRNAMNPANGLLLCRFCDVAFEKGSITVGADLGITVSGYLRDRRDDVVRSWLAPIPAELRIRRDAQYPPDPRYLQWKTDLLAGAGG